MMNTPDDKAVNQEDYQSKDANDNHGIVLDDALQ